MTQQTKIIAVVMTAAIVMLGVGLTFGSPTIVEGKEVNPAHDVDNGLGNEKNFGRSIDYSPSRIFWGMMNKSF